MSEANSMDCGVGRLEVALDPERAAFEKWLAEERMLTGTWNERRNCYDEFRRA